MEFIWEGIKESIRLILTGDPELYQILHLTLNVSLTATLLAAIVGLPIGAFLGGKKFWGQKIILGIFNALLGLPPVVVGLWLTMFLWRSGPLGNLNLLYTPKAMILAQFCIALPEVIVFTAVAFSQISENFFRQVKALGANRYQQLYLLLKEVRLGLLAAVIAGFGAAISEVGASIMVGGNIYQETRVLTTSILLEVGRGNFGLAIGLSIILMLISFIVVGTLTYWQRKGY
ncbi:ABC transporter permease [Carboxydothermus hydrogenoformans]|uniref:Anion ABC transporter, permease protein n=1 Tax=Carboxydothermus hydrogenoformans (strain ATCC BAA-161 / DSM 6008 / Z-2901) TaxID=246194 RepID=Q3AF45_CARHZ|nr:ABC transporter permease [Carboxydothermus hydrogenoformans]ABB15296.1 anion ABC transporter, permease protein [Carboxydothermus hydrogenoformans Z-2901]